MSHWRNPRDLSRPKVGAVHRVRWSLRRRWRVNWGALICAALAVAIMAVVLASRVRG